MERKKKDESKRNRLNFAKFEGNLKWKEEREASAERRQQRENKRRKAEENSDTRKGNAGTDVWNGKVEVDRRQDKDKERKIKENKREEKRRERKKGKISNGKTRSKTIL